MVMQKNISFRLKTSIEKDIESHYTRIKAIWDKQYQINKTKNKNQLYYFKKWSPIKIPNTSYTK